MRQAARPGRTSPRCAARTTSVPHFHQQRGGGQLADTVGREWTETLDVTSRIQAVRSGLALDASRVRPGDE
ncbi:hypothetical protein [Burkholderia ambifaria]|uniref:Uncharacterized protein n=1 Tax=Burkholderia ambifaria TaxID=152480 RepID=A0AA41JJ73_9BURK|nr:hypothetical protein [Burkholderia ambifaria]MBR8129007.1 hypothetical protein [Burkholderia ambifaria]